MPEVPNLAQGAAHARAAQEAATKPPSDIKARTAFLVFIDENGAVGSTPNLAQALTVERPPSAEEVKYACNEIVEELYMQKQAILTTNSIVSKQVEMSRQMRDQQEAAQAVAAARDIKLAQR